MPKIELSLDIDRLGQDVLKRLYAMTDEVFESEGLKYVDRGVVQVHEDRGREKDYGRFWAAIFALEESPELSANLEECIWYNGLVKENLITGFLRSQYMDSRQKKGINFDLDMEALKEHGTKRGLTSCIL